MVFLTAFFLELIVLFVLARALTIHLSLLFYKFGMGERSVMRLLAILFLPGTFIHEFSHYLMCVILRVKVFRMSLLPKQMENNQIKMGVLEHAKTDFFKDSLIGASPFIFGNIILFTFLLYFKSHNPFGLNWLTVLVGFVVFQIGNTMLSSKKDMEGSFKFLLVMIFIASLAYLFDFRISMEQLDQSIPTSLVSVIKQANLFLLIPIILDLLLISLILGLSSISKF